MADQKTTVPETTQTTAIETAPVRRDFFTTYSKPLIYAGAAIIILIAGWFAYKYLIKLPKEGKANEAVFAAEGLFDKMGINGFNKDSVSIVLNGGNLDGNKVTGLLKVISAYGGTHAANRATYMVGASYLHIGEFDKAIKYLKEFDAHGAHQTEIKANMMIGHAYAEKKQTAEALSWYKKAASVNEEDEAFTADALITAAAYAEFTNNTKEAIELYKKARDKYQAYPSVQNGEVAKRLARLGVLN